MDKKYHNCVNCPEKQREQETKAEASWLDQYAPVLRAMPESNGTRFYERLGYRIGIVCDRFFYDSIVEAAEFVYLTPDNWKTAIAEKGIDVLLFVSTWTGLHDEWTGVSNTKSEKGQEAIDLIHLCKEQGIPTIFYSKEDPPDYLTYLDYARQCDYIFTSCAECVPYYQEDCQTDRVRAIPFGINPVLHNPIGVRLQDKRGQKTVLFAGSWMKKFPKRCEDMHILFDGILSSDHRLEIIDRFYGNDYYLYPEKYREYLHPSIEHKDLLKVHKLFHWAVNINTVFNSETMFANRTFELLASGVALLSNYSIGVNNILPSVFLIHTKSEVPRILDGFTEEELYAHQLTGIRTVLAGHTCFERITAFLEPLGLDCRQPKRTILVIAEQETPQLKSCFQRQSYPHKQLVSQHQVTEALLEQYDMVTWFEAGSDYGPYYLEDLINGFKYTDCDYITKDAWYEGTELHEGREHMYVSHMGSPYRTVFWRESFPDGFFLAPPMEQELENGYSIDHHSYCRRPIHRPETSREYLLSVIVPVYNNGLRLYGKFFTSIRRSSLFEDMEILLIDDGSTEKDTLCVEESLRERYSNIRLFRFEDGGSGSASRPRNKGVELASAEYLAFCDPDDEAICDGYAMVYQRAKRERVDLAFGDAYRADRKLFRFRWYEMVRSETKRTRFKNGLKVYSPSLALVPVRLQSMVIRRSFLLDNNLTQVVGAIGEDTLFSWQAAKAAQRICAVDTITHVYYANTAGSVTNQVLPSFFQKLLLLQRYKVDWLVRNDLMETYMDSRHNNYCKAWIFKKLSQASDVELCCRLVEKILRYYDEYYHNTSEEMNRFLDHCRQGRYDDAAEYVAGLYKGEEIHPSRMVEVYRPDSARSRRESSNKLSGLLQCFRDNGAGYTIRRTLFHMGLWEDEEAPKCPENRPKLILRVKRTLRQWKDKGKSHR